MKPTLPHIHCNSATDRTQGLTRTAAVILAALLLTPTAIPAVSALSAPKHAPSVEETTREQAPLQSITIQTDLVSDRGILTPADPARMTADLMETVSRSNPHEHPEQESQAEEEFFVSIEDSTIHPTHPDQSVTPVPEEEDSTEAVDIFDPTLPLTQELIALRIESRMDMQVKGGSTVKYPYPAGSMAVDLYKDGRQILKGQVVDIGGTVYVPVQRFADLFGSFKTVYTEATERVVITGTNLSITVQVGDPYITVNERIFYTGKKVISLGGWIFVPLTSMCKALNATVNIRSGYYDATVTSGDTTKVKWASEYYDSTDLYWLSRIISAEAKGEPFTGQIAVGNVVLNRVRSSQYPNTVKGVIFDTKYGTQFSPVASGTIYQTPTASAVMAAKICLEGYSLSTQMIYFYNPKIATSSWIGRTRPYIMTIGNHKFYG